MVGLPAALSQSLASGARPSTGQKGYLSRRGPITLRYASKEKTMNGFDRVDDDIVISIPLRTAISTFGGTLKDIPVSDLGTTVAREVLSRSGLAGEQIDQVIVGNVLTAGQGMKPGRQVAIKAGLPVSVPGMALNRVCGSGVQAVISAVQAVALGDGEVILAGGIENMDQAPFLDTKARYGYRMGMPGVELLDHMVYDGPWGTFNNYHMGLTAENVAEQLVSYAVAGVAPSVMGLGPIPASRKALERASLSVRDIDVFEVDEAFGSVAAAIQRELQIPEDTLNPVGGAYRPWPPHRRQRRGTGGQAAARAGAPSGALRPRHPLHRRRHGHRGGLRAQVTSG